MSIVMTSTSGPDGMLHLDIPGNKPDTKYEVEIVVRRQPVPQRNLTPEEYRKVVLSLAGSVTDPTFVLRNCRWKSADRYHDLPARHECLH